MQASSVENAHTKTTEFMEAYGDDKVWDWYVIGGRWTGLLSAIIDEFEKQAKIIVPQDEAGFFSQNTVNVKQSELQALWESLAGEGPNPWANHYDLPKTGGVYDIAPLTLCLPKVKEWQQDPVKCGDNEVKQAKERYLDGEKGPDYNMYGYCLKRAGHLYAQDFSFGANVFNLETYNFAIPDNTEGWYAVIVDMHT